MKRIKPTRDLELCQEKKTSSEEQKRKLLTLSSGWHGHATCPGHGFSRVLTTTPPQPPPNYISSQPGGGGGGGLLQKCGHPDVSFYFGEAGKL